PSPLGSWARRGAKDTVSAAGASETAAAVVMFLLMGLFSLYSLVFETLNKGQSIGKMALRIQVIKVAGGKITFSDYAARWVFRLIDIYFSLGAIASILVVSSAKGQRIGDVVANTAVVKTSPKMNLNLDDLLAIHQKSTYTPRNVPARKLQEAES
ncbi:RDD family protein, partial [Fulvivirgaceae bacterium PWU4]